MTEAAAETEAEAARTAPHRTL